MLDCLLDYFQDSYGRSNKQVWVGGRDWNLVAWTLYYRPRSVIQSPSNQMPFPSLLATYHPPQPPNPKCVYGVQEKV